MDEKRVKNLWDDPETVAESLGLLIDDRLDCLVVDFLLHSSALARNAPR